ncbi:MAG: hypothetical protein B7733_11245 [Myxococcales bacterium FL481]|nr:MAG: hypothetical protein B7733_11245 [Myxococcales bacterium FL481]
MTQHDSPSPPRSGPPRGAILTAVAVCGAAVAGCAEDLPDEAVVEYPRVLSIRSEVVASPWVDPSLEIPSRTEAMPFETVRFDPLVASPVGREDVAGRAPAWIMCPRESGVTPLECWERAGVTQFSQLPMCPTAVDPTIGGAVPPCVVGREPNATLSVPFSPHVLSGGDYEVLFVAGGGGVSTEQCADEFFSGAVDLPDACIYAYRAQKVGPIGAVLNLAHETDPGLVEMFVPGFEPLGAEEVGEADRNVRIKTVTVERLAEGQDRGQPVVVEDGALIDMTGVDRAKVSFETHAEDYQTFKIPVNEGEGFELFPEEPENQWFRTSGDMEYVENAQGRLTYIWGPGDERPEPGRIVYLFAVARDYRYGTDFRWLGLRF